MTAQFNPSGTVTGVNDVPGLPQALADLHAATDAVAASLAAFRPAPFTRGFTYTPDATYEVPSTGISHGAGFSAGFAPPVLKRWGSGLVMAGTVRFDAADLTSYDFYSDPLIILPDAWFGGHPPFIRDLPPFMACGALLQHIRPGLLVQTDGNAVVGLGSPSNPPTPGAAGIYLVTENLNSDLFQPGDSLDFQLLGGFLLAPDGADFT